MFISCRCCGFNRNWIHGVKNPQSPTIFGSKSEIIWATSFLGHGPWTVGTFFPYDGYLGTLPRESSRAMISLLVTSPLLRWPLQCFSTCWSCCHQILVVTCGSPQESKIGGDHPSNMRMSSLVSLLNLDYPVAGVNPQSEFPVISPLVVPSPKTCLAS